MNIWRVFGGVINTFLYAIMFEYYPLLSIPVLVIGLFAIYKDQPLNKKMTLEVELALILAYLFWWILPLTYGVMEGDD